MRRPTTRALSATAIALCLLVLGGCQVLNRSSGSDNLQGRIVWPKDGDLWVYDLASKQQQKITNLPTGAAVTGASWSPDGKQVVYAQFWRRPNERQTGADLFIANSDGSEARVFVSRDAPNTVLETPQWSASGRVTYTQRHVTNGREATSIMRIAEGGEPELLVDDGYNPAISPDEQTLIYLRPTRVGQSMMKKTLGQPGDGCELMSDQVFQYLSLPRISPDNTRVALGGSGEPNLQAPSGCGGDPRTKPAALAPLFGPSVAYAASTSSHGQPADIWTLNLDGSNMQRVADIKDDDPSLAWSPDGTHMAIFGVAALYASDLKGGQPSKLVDQGGYGALDWSR